MTHGELGEVTLLQKRLIEVVRMCLALGVAGTSSSSGNKSGKRSPMSTPGAKRIQAATAVVTRVVLSGADLNRPEGSSQEGEATLSSQCASVMQPATRVAMQSVLNKESVRV